MTPGGRTVTHLVGGRFRLVERLGSGGMGTVWRAFDTGSGVERALKEIRIPDHVSIHDRELLIERAHREARNAARLGVHPHVVTVHDLVEDHGAQWIVMDLVSGCSLATMIAHDGALDEREVARIGIALLDALAHGHRKGVLHRDVKPSNVLITADGTVRLTDFGIAAYETDHRITAAGGVIGTPAYMAPERIRGGEGGPASDLFSLATTLLHAAQGVSPFGRGTTFATMHAVVYEGPTTPVQATRTYTVLSPILAKEPSARPPAERIRRQLQALLRAPEPSPPATPNTWPTVNASPTTNAWPTTSAFYEAPTMFSIVTDRLRFDDREHTHHDRTQHDHTQHDRSGRYDPDSANGLSSTRVSRGGDDTDRLDADELDTVGIEVPAPDTTRNAARNTSWDAARNAAQDTPRLRRTQPGSDVDPATIEQPVWIDPNSTQAAPGPVGTRHPGGRRPSRRDLLFAGAATAGLGMGAGTAVWAVRRIRRSAHPGTAGSGPASAPLTLGLPAAPGVEFAGSLVADHRGYYREAGFTSTRFRGSGSHTPTVTALVASGAAFVGVTAPEVVAREIMAGARLRIIGTQRQKSPWAIVSLADKPIRTPQEMIGMRIATTAGSAAVWTSFLAAAGVPETAVQRVIVPDHVQIVAQALAQRQVDAALSSVSDAPVALTRQGVGFSTFLIADHGYPLVSNAYVVTTDAVTAARKRIKAFLTAEIRGWKQNLADPMLGAHLTTDVYAKSLGLDATEQTEKNRALNVLVQTAETRRDGLFTMTDALIEANVRLLSTSAAPLTAGQLFDLSVIQELYYEQPHLI
ncbi:protein kinase domain-containing protein [Candidatus Protofrankia californiensis]|uniref:protein kinase domain-containing protein n=1 Tax=Candidatus Protofrankia californiensis TaxID=1839754 RepID=UPI0010417737|nr:ABC transporter substrate-binding protein [Candidatus Protofrankia californiensis]